jgi:hypothetical protein
MVKPTRRHPWRVTHEIVRLSVSEHWQSDRVGDLAREREICLNVFNCQNRTPFTCPTLRKVLHSQSPSLISFVPTRAVLLASP